MTTQQAYEAVRQYLTRPGARQAMFPGRKFCEYQTEIDGVVHRCAVGCLLSADAISEIAEYEFEGGVEALLSPEDWGEKTDDWGPLAVSELVDVDSNFLSSAQGLHDEPGNWDGGVFAVDKLDQIAREYGLRVVDEEGGRVLEKEATVQEPVAIGVA